MEAFQARGAGALEGVLGFFHLQTIYMQHNRAL